MARVVQILPHTFEREVLKSDRPVLVYFWAPWCADCQTMENVVLETAEEVGDAARAGRVNTDAYPELAAQYGIRGVPTLLVFRGGKPARAFQGITPRKVLREALQGT